MPNIPVSGGLTETPWTGTEQVPILTSAVSTSALVPYANVNVQASAAGVTAAATGADKVVASFTLPASTFTQAGQIIAITSSGSFAANADSKTVKIIFNPASATVGQTVGAGGTTIATTGAVTTNGGGWQMEGQVVKYGAVNSNTQLGIHSQAQVGGAVSALIAPQTITATENAPIFIAVTSNCATAATDVVFNFLEVSWTN